MFLLAGDGFRPSGATFVLGGLVALSMVIQRLSPAEASTTLCTQKGLFPGVGPLVGDEVVFQTEASIADVTGEGFVAHVQPLMFGQVLLL